MVATGYRSRGNWGMAHPSCKQVSKQAYILPSTLHAGQRGEGSKMPKNQIEIASNSPEHRPRKKGPDAFSSGLARPAQ